MSNEDEYDSLFKALGHRVRRQILDLLKDGPKTTGELCEAVADMDRCTVMQHLSVLDKAGLVIIERRGRERWNHLNALPIYELQNRWIASYATHALAVLGSLKEAVEGEGADVI